MAEIKPGTPLPWRTVGGDAILAGRDEALVVVGSAEREDDNSYIVTACNAYPSLLNGLREARRILAEIDEYQKHPERGDYSVECACCMGELLDSHDYAILAKLDTLLSQEGGQ